MNIKMVAARFGRFTGYIGLGLGPLLKLNVLFDFDELFVGVGVVFLKRSFSGRLLVIKSKGCGHVNPILLTDSFKTTSIHSVYASMYQVPYRSHIVRDDAVHCSRECYPVNERRLENFLHFFKLEFFVLLLLSFIAHFGFKYEGFGSFVDECNGGFTQLFAKTEENHA
uniref:CSON014763 protein n=2 Tax=Culicoides sonorensis TaxID=179676 RepID=A0A336MG10_CULSO